VLLAPNRLAISSTPSPYLNTARSVLRWAHRFCAQVRTLGALSTAFRGFPLDFLTPECQYVDMVCIYCGHETSVTNSRLQKRNNQVWRRRQCEACKAIFTTHEAIDLTSALLVDSRGSAQPFLPDLLFTDVLLALKDRKDTYLAAREVTSTIIQKLLKNPQKPLFLPRTISKTTAEVLKKFDKRAHLRYVSEHPSLQ
jgi:transcriptional repressor NrdR